MGAQIFTSRTLNDTLNPKWNFNCQFHIKDLYQDVLCITIFERDQFSPDGQLSSLFSSHVHVFHHPYSFTNIKIFFKGEKSVFFYHYYTINVWINFKCLVKCSFLFLVRLPGSDRGSCGNHKERVGEQGTGDAPSSAARGSYRGSVGPPRPTAFWQQIAA